MLGEVIHGYRIDRVLSAEGGFGDVYLATHVESGAEAVVKVLKPEMSALRDIVARFFNEARAAASIHHPGIVQIHNVGYHGDRAYLLMERLRGGDLETRLRAGPLPVDRAVVFLRQTAGAIGAAHERGIVHRDLKPANLFVVEDPDVIGGERVKVLDFGIAKLTADTGAGKTQGVFGTPAYMSPEQCASTGAVDARADLYSLGCIFYELVCGRPPFGHGGIELIAAHLRDTPLPPRAIAPWVPPAIEQVILQLLEKQPDRRLPSCAALVTALDQAAAVSGLAAGSMPQLPAGAAASGPHMPSGNLAAASASPPTTLGAATSAASTTPPASRRGAWLGIAAVVVVAGAITTFVAIAGHRGPDTGSAGSNRSGVGSDVVANLPDAGVTTGSAGAGVVAAPLDSGVIAAVPHEADAATVDAPDNTRIAASVSDPVARSSKKDDVPRIPTSTQEQTSHVSPDAAAPVAKLVDEGNRAMFAGDFRTAQLRYEAAVSRAPEPRYLLNLATAHFQLGHFGEAASAARAALGASPSSRIADKARTLLTRISDETKRQGITLKEPISPTELKPQANAAPTTDAGATHDDPEALHGAGKAAMDSAQFEKALSLFHRAYEIDPKPEVLLDIGIAETRLGRCRDARRTLQRVSATWAGEPPAKKAQQLLERLGPCP